MATVVVEARPLLREALVSLLETHSYKVVCSASSWAAIPCSVLDEQPPKLVILGALSPNEVAETTSAIRNSWQDVKIVKLLESASSTALPQLLALDVDACIPMDAAPRTLVYALQLITCEPLRVLVVGGTKTPIGLTEETVLKGQALAADLASSLEVIPSATPCAVGVGVTGDGTAGDYGAYAFSKREEEILRALVRGYSNKMMARMHSITEATVKVHMKAILRKIRVANRTQAAIWALRSARFSEVSERVAPIDIQLVQFVNGHS